MATLNERERAWLNGVLSGLDQGILPEEGLPDEAVMLVGNLSVAALNEDPDRAYTVASEGQAVINKNQRSKAVMRAVIDALEMGVAHDHADCVNQLGTLYFLGTGLQQDFERARRLYQKAADLGSPSGIVNLAYLYYYGRGVEVDQVRAFQLFTRAATTADHPEAYWKLADMFRQGIYVDKDDQTAFVLYQRAYSLTRENVMRARPAHHMADYLMSGIPDRLDPDPRAALMLYSEAEISYYDQLDLGFSQYRQALDQAIAGQAKARKAIARNRVGRRFRFDNL